MRRFGVLLCFVLVLAVIAAAVKASSTEAHPSDYCGTGLNVTGNYAVAFVKQRWRDNADGSRSLIRTYKHAQRIGDTSQFRYTHKRSKVCGGIL